MDCFVLRSKLVGRIGISTAVLIVSVRASDDNIIMESTAGTRYHPNYVNPTVGGFTGPTKKKKVDVYEDARRDVSGIEEWAMNCGVQKVDGVQLTDTSNQQDNNGILDVGIMTTTDIPANSPVLYVPNNMVLSALKAQQEFGQFEGAEQLLWRINEGEHIPQFYLMIKLLKEYENGNQSPYYTYLNSLPRYFASGAAMTHFCCTKCLPPLVGKLASKERIRFSKFFQALRQVPEDVLSHSVSRDRRIAKWAFAIVYTRSIQTYDGDVKIAPLADMVSKFNTYSLYVAGVDHRVSV